MLRDPFARTSVSGRGGSRSGALGSALSSRRAGLSWVPVGDRKFQFEFYFSGPFEDHSIQLPLERRALLLR